MFLKEEVYGTKIHVFGWPNKDNQLSDLLVEYYSGLKTHGEKGSTSTNYIISECLQCNPSIRLKLCKVNIQNM